MRGGAISRCPGFVAAGLLCLAAFGASAEARQPEGGPPALEQPVVGGWASFYSRRLHGRLVATGEVFRNELLTAGSNLFPLGRWLAVRRPGGPCVAVRVNDRMHARHTSRIVDLSYAAARRLGMLAAGVVRVEAALLPPGFDHRRDNCGLAFGE